MEGFFMKKAFWISILILILVCLNWINVAQAQLTPEQIEAYQKLLDEKSPSAENHPQRYNSPEIFGDPSAQVTDSGLSRHRQGSVDPASSATTEQSDEFIWDNQSNMKLEHSPFESEAQHQLVFPSQEKIEKFGQGMFANPGLGEFNEALIPESYLLGPGDNIIVNLWGRVQQEWNLTIDRSGKIFIPKVGEITAWGMTISQFEESLDKNLSQIYTGFKRKVTLGKIRAIKIFIYGEVSSPGGYTVSALSTLFNALHRAGGPSDNGSLRQIKLIRDRQSTVVDLYDFLITGDNSCDLPLQSGDVIFVPLAGRQAKIRGEIKRPGIYELVGEETVADLLALGGGPTADAYMGRLMLDRVGQDDSRKLIDIDFSEQAQSEPQAKLNNPILADGDDLSVFSIYQMRQNIVWITGMVKHSGTFERIDQMRLSDLISQGQLLPNNVFYERADLFRHSADGQIEIFAVDLQAILDGNDEANLKLCDLDSLAIYNTDNVLPEKSIYIDGMVKTPGRYPLFGNMTVADLIFLAGNLREEAYLLDAELARINREGQTDLIRINLNHLDNGGNLRLAENDRLFIRRIPGYELHRMVTIEGEVRFPGRYSLTNRDESLWELLERAGGFTSKAFPTGTVYRRKAIADNLHRKNIAAILRKSQPLVVDSTGRFKAVEMINFDTDRMDRVIIDMDRLLTSTGAEGDISLMAGDNIFIPEVPTGISVLGEVCSNGTIRFEPDKKIKYYLQQAGGFTKRADKKEARLVRANGSVITSGNILNQKAELGDIVVVPAEIKHEKDWFKFITSSLSILTGVATTILIVDRL